MTLSTLKFEVIFLLILVFSGWAMQCGAFIFINRKWEVDKLILSKMINYFASLKHRTQVMFSVSMSINLLH